ncbi:MAG: DegT/DnrJ/EryC1/StrS family aminotransferase [Candidatus Hydrogenedentota bacterium]
MIIPRNRPNFEFKDLLEIYPRLIKNREVIEEQCIASLEKITGFKYIILFPFARSAIYTLLNALNIKEKEIILPSYICKVVPQAVLLSQNRPVFIDILEKDFNIDLSQIKTNINQNTGVIIPALMYGNPLTDDLDTAVLQKNNILLIEDAAMAFGNRNLLSLRYPYSCVVYSFNIGKIISSIEGGMIATNNKQIYDKLNQYIYNNILSQALYGKVRIILKYFTILLFFNDFFYKLIYLLRKSEYLSTKIALDTSLKIDIDTFRIKNISNLQMLLLLSQIKKLDFEYKKREELFDYFNNNFSIMDEIQLPQKIDGSSLSHYTLITKNIKRDFLRKELHKSGIETIQAYDYSIPYLKEYSNYKGDREYPVALYISKHSITLPFYYRLSFKQAEHIVKMCKKIILYSKQKSSNV